MYEKNALNNFKDVLGKYCAINQFIESSKRCFVSGECIESGEIKNKMGRKNISNR